MDHGLNAKYALAFGIDFQSQPAAVQLEDRQIIHRSLIAISHWAVFLAFAIFGAARVAHDGFDCLYVQQHAAAVNQRLKDLIHVPADFENQVAAVLELIVEVLVMKPAPLLFLGVERKAQAGGINPTLAEPGSAAL